MHIGQIINTGGTIVSGIPVKVLWVLLAFFTLPDLTALFALNKHFFSHRFYEKRRSTQFGLLPLVRVAPSGKKLSVGRL